MATKKKPKQPNRMPRFKQEAKYRGLTGQRLKDFLNGCCLANTGSEGAVNLYGNGRRSLAGRFSRHWDKRGLLLNQMRNNCK